jgi:histidinol-phosphatase (PHP family)
MNYGLFADYHTHTYRCGHATGRAAEYVAAARAIGLGGIGISDHLPLLPHPDPGMNMPPSELDDYVAEVQELKATHPGYVLLGIEADFLPGSFSELKSLLEAYPFDYVIGSVHYLESWGFDSPHQLEEWDRRQIDDVYREYFGLLEEVAASGLFTILGHLDLVKKFGHRPSASVLEMTRRLVGTVARSGLMVELNTAGLRRPVEEIYPEISLLRELRGARVPICFGSDAHAPGEVGAGFREAVALARAAGYDRVGRLREQGGGLRAALEYQRL